MFDKQQFGTALKTLRDQRRLSLRDVGEATGISASTLLRIENGGTFEIDTFAKLCKWMNANPSQFFYGLEVSGPIEVLPFIEIEKGGKE